jgi:two-component system, NtrC family, response regulator GlrR
MLAYDEARDQFSREFLVANLQRAGGNVSKAARLAKRNRSDFYKLLERYRVQTHDYKSSDTHRTEGEKES